MKLEEIDEVITRCQQQLGLVPQIQQELNQALGYKQALIDAEEKKPTVLFFRYVLAQERFCRLRSLMLIRNRVLYLI